MIKAEVAASELDEEEAAEEAIELEQEEWTEAEAATFS